MCDCRDSKHHSDQLYLCKGDRNKHVINDVVDSYLRGDFCWHLTAFFGHRTPRRCLLRGRLSLNLSHSVTQGKANAFSAQFLK